MNKEKMKGIVMGFILCAVLTATTAAIAASQTVTRELTYGVGVTLHGQAVEFEEGDRPFVIDGRTFLPVRAIAGLVGLPVDFDAENNVVLLGDRDIHAIGTVATINGVEITASDLGIWMRDAVFSVMLAAQMGMDVGDPERAIREQAVRSVARILMITEYAERHGIALSADTVAQLQHDLDDVVAFFGEAEFLDMLREEGVSGLDQYLQTATTFVLVDYVISTIMADPDKLAEFGLEQEEEEEKIFAAKHILIMADYEDAQALAESLAERAKAGEDFAELVAEYGQDPGMQQSPEGYTFTRGVMVPEFESATEALEIGDISGVVESQFGYHIIKRIQPNEDDVMRPWGEENALTALHNSVFSAFGDKADAAEIIFLPALDLVPIN